MASDAELDAERVIEEIEELPNRRWWALAVVALAQLMVVLDGTVVTIALPSAQRALHISNADRPSRSSARSCDERAPRPSPSTTD
jgi:hypothetical protein